MTHTHQYMRVGDVERDVAVELLANHFAAGRLSHEEFNHRSDLALSARTSGELDVVLWDLPGGPRRVRADRGRSKRNARIMAAAVCSCLLALVVGYEVSNEPAPAYPVCNSVSEPNC